jgi:hypothetical protein
MKIENSRVIQNEQSSTQGDKSRRNPKARTYVSSGKGQEPSGAKDTANQELLTRTLMTLCRNPNYFKNSVETIQKLTHSRSPARVGCKPNVGHTLTIYLALRRLYAQQAAI